MADNQPPTDEDETPPLKAGYLWKKGELRHNWTWRYVELHGPMLMYFKVNERTKAKERKGIIPLRDAKVSKFYHRSRPATFKIQHPEGRVFVFDAETDEAMYAWLEAIGDASHSALEKFRVQPYLDRLGIEPNYTLVQLKKKYRRLALQAHPDKGGDPEHFMQLTEAYEILCSMEEEVSEMGRDETIVEHDIFVTRQKGNMGFGLTIARDESSKAHVVVRKVSGVTEQEGKVQEGDIILKVDSVPIKSMELDEVMQKFKDVPAGSSVKLRVSRRTAEHKSSVFVPTPPPSEEPTVHAPPPPPEDAAATADPVPGPAGEDPGPTRESLNAYGSPFLQLENAVQKEDMEESESESESGEGEPDGAAADELDAPRTHFDKSMAKEGMRRKSLFCPNIIIDSDPRRLSVTDELAEVGEAEEAQKPEVQEEQDAQAASSAAPAAQPEAPRRVRMAEPEPAGPEPDYSTFNRNRRGSQFVMELDWETIRVNEDLSVVGNDAAADDMHDLKAELATLTMKVAECEAQLQGKDAALAALQTKLGDAQRQLEERDALLKGKQVVTAQLDEKEKLLVEKEALLVAQESELAVRAARIVELEAKTNTLERRLRDVIDIIDDLTDVGGVPGV